MILGALVAIPHVLIRALLEFLEELLPIFKNEWVILGGFTMLVLVAPYIVGSNMTPATTVGN